MRFNTLNQWLNWQQTLHPKEIELGLERCRTVAQRLNLLSPAFPIISVAGTNGKGSSVMFLDNILSAAGYNIGRYTSPHLLHYNERICVNGNTATDADICQAFELIDKARAEISLTYFEFSTLAAVLIFQQYKVDLAILEVGLGGRLDAVNIFDAEIALVTAIDIDHVDWLGDDREAIGFEKAGILRQQRPAVCSDP
ncbi:bifunctional folylpolyglutamate synthase/dihydrofolate synthase, partial [Candidatus Marithrix sp. Canyon 246]